MVLFIRKLKFCLFKFSFCFCTRKQFSFSFLLRKWKDDQMLAWCDHKAIIVEWVSSLKQLLKDVFRTTITSINLGFIVYICDAHKMLYFCNQNGIVTFCQSCLLVRFLMNTATFCWENFGFLSFSVIVTLVDSRDGLVEPLLWSFVIAPLRSSLSKLL
jgi:hypothetical protein